MSNEKPVRGEVWDVDLNPVLGHEQGGKRPALVVSVDQFNQGPSGLVIVVPITSRDRNIRSRIAIEAGEGGCKTRSFAMCEAIRSISLERMTRRCGMVSSETMEKVEYCSRYPWYLIFKPRAVPAGSRPVRHGRNPGPRLARVGDGGRG